jgi:hypothetical protein
MAKHGINTLGITGTLLSKLTLVLLYIHEFTLDPGIAPERTHININTEHCITFLAIGNFRYHVRFVMIILFRWRCVNMGIKHPNNHNEYSL